MFLQFELWKSCKHHCGYCFNKFIEDKRDKKKILDYAIKTLENRNIPENSTIGLMGGEFFDGQLSDKRTKEKFYQLCSLIIDKLGPTGRFCITASMMYKNAADYLEFCNFILKKRYVKNVLICTSYDKKYRFTDITLKNWIYLVNKTYEMSKDIRIHVEMILTQYLIDTIKQNPDYLNQFQKTYQCRVDFNIPYLPFYSDWQGITKEAFEKKYPGFFPKRKDFLELLQKHGNLFDLRGISDHKFHSSELHYSINGKDWVILPERDKMETTCTNLTKCHNCCGYLDSATKIQDDIKIFINSGGM